MPMVPVPKEQQVFSQGNLAYQSVPNATPEAFGAGLARGLEQAANSTNNIALQNQQIKNQTDIVNAQNALMTREQELRNGNPQKGIVGYSTLEGQNAIDAMPDYQQKLQDAYKDIRSGLNPAAQREFDFMGTRILRGGMDAMGSHSAQQTRVANHEAFRSKVTLAQQAALNDADDPDAWAHHIGEVQDASHQASMAAGQYGDVMEANRRADLGKVYEDRTKDLMLRDPIAAAKFYHDNQRSIPPERRYELERALKVTTDAQYSRGDGTTAYHSAIGQPNGSALPADKGAPDLKPFDQKRVDEVAKYVKSPTLFDDEIDEAAKKYNVSPNEIKLKIAIESGGHANAVNPKSGATGLGQFTADTAARFGITDRTDVHQAIQGIAKMLAANGGTVGGDMSAADRAYYGGNTAAKGPNTDQYVENTRAARQAAFGGGAPAPLTAAELEGKEASVIAAARAQAEQRRPGDEAYADQVASHAHSLLARDVQALHGQDVANMDKAMQAAIHGNAMSMADLPPDIQQVVSRLPAKEYQGVQAQLERNVRAANGEFTHSDAKLVNSLRQRLYLPDGDPNKITSAAQLTPYIANGVNYTDHQRLVKEMQEANTPEGNPFLKQVNSIKTTAQKMLTAKSVVGNVTPADKNPEIADEAAYRFGVDLDQKIQAVRKAGKDPQSLFTPGSPDYVLDPNRVAAFMPSEQEIAARKAQALSQPKPQPAQAAQYPTAHNPKTGERLMLKDGKWVPLQ